MTIERCPTCGKGELVEGTRDVEYEYHGEKTVVKNVHAFFCTECNDFVVDDAEAQRISDSLAAFRAQCHSHDSVFIRSVRKKLHLGQKEAGELFGGGVNAFSRYETGKVSPPVSLLKLFRILDTYPELLALVR
ncbi:MAG: type II toxin-antitoxin system MqsA family antitoxin [Desulfovibrio sp.]|nr:type II toxin-antitoxin system MqsA family antitoxin [Desulfovibrio sp.]